MKTYRKKEEPEKLVQVRRRDGKFVVRHEDGNETVITKHKLEKRYELLSKTDNA